MPPTGIPRSVQLDVEHCFGCGSPLNRRKIYQGRRFLKWYATLTESKKKRVTHHLWCSTACLSKYRREHSGCHTPVKYYVDLPDPHNLAGPWVNIGVFDNKEEARKFIKEAMSCDQYGRLNIITKITEG